MEKHKCKLCFKNFANGRALGGHMRSHVMNLYSPPKSDQPNFDHQFGDSAPSPSTSSSSSEEENEDRELLYGLRENPKKSFKLASPEFSFPDSVVVVQDRESETESSKNPTRRRSKRIRKLDHHQNQCDDTCKKPNLGKSGPWTAPRLEKSSSWAAEQEPMSSISDTSPEEDVAYCLMMLSRDNWIRDKTEREEEDEDDEDQSDTCEFGKPLSNRNCKNNQRGKGKYKCETCFKAFKSYQALGGHRASHKKAKVNVHNCSLAPEETQVELRNKGNREEKIHECPFCFRVFASGQALGGHKRSHLIIGSQSNNTHTTATAKAKAEILANKSPLKFGESYIDLNLPAPIDDDDDEFGDEASQIELSAVSDAEFVKSN